MLIPLLILSACADVDVNEHCRTSPVDVGADEDPGIGFTATEMYEMAPQGAGEFSILCEPATDFTGQPTETSATVDGSLALQLTGSGVAYYPALDDTCTEEQNETLLAPVMVELAADGVSVEREGSISAQRGGDEYLLEVELADSDFAGDVASWIAEEEAAAVASGCTIDAPTTRPEAGGAGLVYYVNAECPDMMATVGTITISWTLE